MHGTSDVTLDFVEKLGSVTPDIICGSKGLSSGTIPLGSRTWWPGTC